jgi:hypothetical protein
MLQLKEPVMSNMFQLLSLLVVPRNPLVLAGHQRKALEDLQNHQLKTEGDLEKTAPLHRVHYRTTFELVSLS